ncbi:MAG: DUF2189 domain-containing protein [Chromatiaceae bacterium]|nr:DUF2189 domain-containing protein [Chromatiaceae bacterium]
MPLTYVKGLWPADLRWIKAPLGALLNLRIKHQPAYTWPTLSRPDANQSDTHPLSNLSPAPFHLADISNTLGSGWGHFRTIPGPSLLLGFLLALITTSLLLIPLAIGAPALALILAGGFALIGPLLLPPWLALLKSRDAGQRPGLGLAWRGYREVGAGFWALAGACCFLLLVWITDAGILYAFLVGAGASLEEGSQVAGDPGAAAKVGTFIRWSSLMGACLAAGVHVIAAFAVPLLYEGRAQPIPAIHASVRAMFYSPGPALAWGLTIILGLLVGILLPPLLALVLPVLAYAHYELYRIVFPPTREATGPAEAAANPGLKPYAPLEARSATQSGVQSGNPPAPAGTGSRTPENLHAR